MDINMPVMDGLTATKEIREMNQGIPIIIQTSFSLDVFKEKASAAGCNDFISKPVDPELLMHKIRQFVTHCENVNKNAFGEELEQQQV